MVVSAIEMIVVGVVATMKMAVVGLFDFHMLISLNLKFLRSHSEMMVLVVLVVEAMETAAEG